MEDEKDSFDNVIDVRFEGKNGIKMRERELANEGAVNTEGEALHVLVEGYRTNDDDYRFMTVEYEKNGFHPFFKFFFISLRQLVALMEYVVIVTDHG